jgi:cytochrome c oxidase subunit 3
MPGTVLTEELEITHGGPGGGAGDGRGDGSSGRGGQSPSELPTRIYQTGVWLALAAIVMFFMALVSAYIVRKGLNDWRSLTLPRILWLNTAVLIASSITLERARTAFTRDNEKGFRLWWSVTTALGFVFLAGQYLAWRQLAATGIYLATNASSSFFYLLTAAHAVHLLGGIAALLYVLVRGWAHLRRRKGIGAEVAGIYWHFMDGLWVFLLLVLQMGR